MPCLLDIPGRGGLPYSEGKGGREDLGERGWVEWEERRETEVGM